MLDGIDGAAVELTLPARASFLALARVIVGGVAAVGPSLHESRLADLRLIVSEVYTNAMEATWRATAERLADTGLTEPLSREAVIDASGPVKIACRVALHEVELVVQDSGSGFDSNDRVHPPVEDPSRLDFERGLGIPLIQFLADEVDYTSTAVGTTVRIIVRDQDLGRSVT